MVNVCDNMLFGLLLHMLHPRVLKDECYVHCPVCI